MIKNSKHSRDRRQQTFARRAPYREGKPKNNRVVCPQCGRMKQLFESEKEACTFIKFNADSLAYGGDRLRVYFCDACGGYHITSHAYKEEYEGVTDRLIESAHRDIKGCKEVAIIRANEIWESLSPEVRMLPRKQFIKFCRNTGINTNSPIYQQGILMLWKNYNGED